MQIHLAAEKRAPAIAQAMAARNLQLLQAIESTLDSLDSDTALMHNIADGFREIGEKLEQANATVAVDPAGAICQKLAMASAVCVRLYQRARGGHEAACADPQLTEEDGVAAAYEGHIEAVNHLHDSIEQVREWVSTHDALLEPAKEGEYTSVDDLFKAMGVNA